MTIELSDQDSDTLLLALGFALSAAIEGKSLILANNLIRLTNVVGKNFPGYEPYEPLTPESFPTRTTESATQNSTKTNKRKAK